MQGQAMSAQVDRTDAQEIADMLGVTVAAIPEDFDTMTAELWHVTFGEDEMPESANDRWQIIMATWAGII